MSDFHSVPHILLHFLKSLYMDSSLILPFRIALTRSHFQADSSEVQILTDSDSDMIKILLVCLLSVLQYLSNLRIIIRIHINRKNLICVCIHNNVHRLSSCADSGANVTYHTKRFLIFEIFDTDDVSDVFPCFVI